VDEELREHRSLVEEWLARDGAQRQAEISMQEGLLASLGYVVDDLGATNLNERGETMYNQCFYLSLARAYLAAAEGGERPGRALLGETALHLKRVIEASVLRAHPEWAGTQVGDDLQAFSDFLFYAVGTNPLLSDLAIVIFDTTSGGTEVRRRPRFAFAIVDLHFALTTARAPHRSTGGRTTPASPARRTARVPPCSASASYRGTTRRWCRPRPPHGGPGRRLPSCWPASMRPSSRSWSSTGSTGSSRAKGRAE
jgi:hypothetical protein